MTHPQPCAICAAIDTVTDVLLVPGDDIVPLCAVCAQALATQPTPGPRWRCLTEAIWAEQAATQIAAWRLLNALAAEPWAADALEGVYLDPEVLARATAGGGAAPDDPGAVIHRDSNGVQLVTGDTITLIKDLPVKGSSMVAKRGTAVRGIRLVQGNPDQIEGRVNDQQIVILCQFVKKTA